MQEHDGLHQQKCLVFWELARMCMVAIIKIKLAILETALVKLLVVIKVFVCTSAG